MVMQQKSLNDIIPPSRRRMLGDTNPAPAPAAPTFANTTPVEPPPPRDIPPVRPVPPARGPRRKFPYGTALIALIVIGVCAGALYAFAGAKVEVTPTASDAYVQGEFTATREPSDLTFDIVTVEKVATQTVKAESTENANDPAQGTITIFNEQPTAQTLIKNTRFESPEGLIYRIQNSVTIPAGSEGAPGTLNVTVYADAAGDRYNIGPTTFTVPGLAGTGAFDKVYAKSESAMTGGFVGNRPSISDATKERVSATLRTALTSDLQKAVAEQIPADFLSVPGASFTTYEELPDTPAAGGDVEVKVRGVTQVVIFPNEALAKAVAFKTLGTYAGQPIRIADVSKLSLTPAVAQAPVGADTFGFTLTGDTTLVWQVDAAKVAGAVAGKTRESAQVMLSGFPEVDKAVLILRPFWTNTFPEEPEKITVTVAGQGK